MITELKKLLISGMKLGVGITAFVGVTSALTPLPVIGKYFGIVKDGAQSLFSSDVMGVPIGPFIGTLGGIIGPTVEEAAVTAAEKSAG